MNWLGILLTLFLIVWITPDHQAYPQQGLSVDSDLRPAPHQGEDRQGRPGYYTMILPRLHDLKQGGSYIEAIADYERALPYVRMFDKEQVSALYMNIAQCYSESGQYELRLRKLLQGA